MTGVLAQMISLVSYGNAFFHTGSKPVDDYAQQTVFQFCNQVDFRTIREENETVVAADPTSWFQYLKDRGCKKLRLYHQDSQDGAGRDRQLAGMIGGGGYWMLEALFEGHSDYWVSRWQVTRKEDPDKKIWSVNYGCTVFNKNITDLQYELQEVKAYLGQALKNIGIFAEQQQLEVWTEIFKKAKGRLTSDTPANAYYDQRLLVDQNYSLNARQALFAAASAFVFGGMGSWNDLSFERTEDNNRYEALSAVLYDVINVSIIAATNSF